MKCPQCERFFSTAEGMIRHRHTRHHNILHPCRCPRCKQEFPDWKSRDQHLKECPEREQKIREGCEEASEGSEEEEVPHLRTIVLVEDGEDHALAYITRQGPTNSADQAYERALWSNLMGNRMPQSRCDYCFEWFVSKSALRQHRDATGHKSQLLRQSRYSGFICQVIPDVNGEDDVKL